MGWMQAISDVLFAYGTSQPPLLQAGAALQAAQLSETRMRAAVQQAERAARKHKVAADKLSVRLADDTAAQERRAKRNADAYARAKRALAASKGQLLHGALTAFPLTYCHQLCHCQQYSIHSLSPMWQRIIQGLGQCRHMRVSVISQAAAAQVLRRQGSLQGQCQPPCVS